MSHVSPTEAWQQMLLDRWRPGTLVVTSGSRLARALKHRHRLQQLAAARRGWLTVEAMSLNNWLQRSYASLWDSEVPASLLRRLQLWQEAASRQPPPEDLSLDFNLLRMLEQSYTAMVRHRLDPTKVMSSYPLPLPKWRAAVCRQFRAALQEQKLWHPAELPLRMAAAIQEGRLTLPQTVLLAGFEKPAPIEEDLFRVLSRHTRVEYFPLPRRGSPCTRAFSLPDMKAEIHYLCELLVQFSQDTRPGAVGVVVPNLEQYAGPLQKILDTILAQPATPGEATYNITLGKPLTGHPLVRAALLPLRFAMEKNHRLLIYSLLQSPYYGQWRRERHQLAVLDRQWRRQDPAAHVNALFNQALQLQPELAPLLNSEQVDLGELLASVCRSGIRSAAGWQGFLEQVWRRLQFPVMAEEADHVAFNLLQQALHSVSVELADLSLDAATFQGWLHQALCQETVQVEASEHAGIQIMGLIEARGLSFQRLFLVGMTHTALPQPVRSFPLLEPGERQHIRGATVESQYDFAWAALEQLLSSAGEVYLSSPEQVGHETVLPTPLWRQAWEPVVDNLWQQPSAVWAAAPWVRSMWRGLQRYPAEQFGEENLPLPVSFPEQLSVSALDTACRCPFLFLVQHLLDLEPLTIPQFGIRAEERGQRLHAALACITRQLRPQLPEKGLSWQDMLPFIEECLEQAVADLTASPYWRVERQRWLSSSQGLIPAWLEQEAERMEQGWRWLAEEISFTGLRLKGWPCTFAGRIDRLDRHSTDGLFCWDYKTGSSPTAAEVFDHARAPQLPAYLRALQQECLQPANERLPAAQPMQAGYIRLKSEKEIKLDNLQKKSGDWQTFLDIWEDRLAELAQELQKGNFSTAEAVGSWQRSQQRWCQNCFARTICQRSRRG
ncbi:MAG: PD-(D/E)XK nuclease family protein [Deltaproteobacteria bacterium]|nr:PD-(D/E)XK nuclease family protein [Deltaproteobacteria bacterium]MBW2070242.1 PD-(D/E)XK nuclease family protein [Deltaproteobacteria bacterium]